MVDKNLVDDYYSNVEASNNNNSWVETKKKIKLVPKKTEGNQVFSSDSNKIEEIKTDEQKESKFKVRKFEPKVEQNNSSEIKEEKKSFKFRKIEKVEEVKIEKKQDFVKKETKRTDVPVVPEGIVEHKKNDSIKTFSFQDKSKNWFKKDKQKWKDFNDRDENFWKKKLLLKKNDFKKWYNNYLDEDKEVTFSRSNKINIKKKEEKNVEDIAQNLTSRIWEEVIIWDVVTLKELSEKMWVPFSKLIAEFMKNGMMVNINSKIDFESACIIAEVFDVKLVRDNSAWISANDILTWNIADLLKEDDSTKLLSRPPVVSIMWHVDHGKTSLLDYIRSEKVAAWEAWWITQSIWAYQVEQNWQKITFLDTPWHEAFTVMRARWAKSTDIAILVVAADEWVKPQTIESINHAKEAWIPVVVAINKMDKEWANPENVKAWLSEHWLIPEDWGWDVPMIPVSAKTWFWIDDLLWVILLISEMQNFKANPNRQAIATVIESHLDQKLGPVATVLINTGTINKWDSIVCKDSYWKVKVLRDYASRGIKEAHPWDPVLIIWLDKVVEWWDVLQVVSDTETARIRAWEYAEIIQAQKSKSMTWIDLIMSKIKAWSLKQLKVVVKADTNWSLEAIKAALLKQSTEETSVSLIHVWVWNISESDVLMCQWSEAILVWFRVSVLPTARSIIESSKVEFLNSEIIYHITDKIEKIVTWMLDPKEVETILWKAIVWWIFFTSKEYMILWLKIKDEETKIESKAKIRVIRWEKMIWKWEIASLKQWVEEVKMIEWPTECGIKFVWNCSPEMGDLMEIYKVEIINKR